MSSSADLVVENAVASSSAEEPKPLSKNAQKKLAKAARIAEQKKERRAYEKERKKEKKRELAAKRAAGEIDDAEEAERRKRARTDSGPKKPFNARIIVDLEFDDMMTENVGTPSFPVGAATTDRRGAGDKIADFAARVHVQREPQGVTSIRLAIVHWPEWKDVYAPRKHE